MTFSRSIFPALFVLLISVTAAFALIICERCGREVKDGSVVCGHCKAPVPGSEVKAVEVEQADDKVSTTPATVVEQEMLAAMTQANKGDPEVALLLLKNAASLNMLLNVSDAAEKITRIQELTAICSKAIPAATAYTCPACGGSGKRTMNITSLTTGKSESIEAHGMVCDTCKGSGKARRSSTLEERKISIAQAGKRFMELQRMRRMEPSGGAWLPAGLAGNLGNKEIAQLRVASAAPCAECLGIGRADCAKCDGSGRIKCDNSQCKDGRVTVTVQGQLVKGQMTRSDKCRNCAGSGRIICSACAGSGSIGCKVCKGSGERASCARCGGQGTAACSKCDGSGKGEDGSACPVCKGQAVELCQTCNGDGKK
jgi:hypothetical protein